MAREREVKVPVKAAALLRGSAARAAMLRGRISEGLLSEITRVAGALSDQTGRPRRCQSRTEIAEAAVAAAAVHGDRGCHQEQLSVEITGAAVENAAQVHEEDWAG